MLVKHIRNLGLNPNQLLHPCLVHLGKWRSVVMVTTIPLIGGGKEAMVSASFFLNGNGESCDYCPWPYSSRRRVTMVSALLRICAIGMVVSVVCVVSS